MPFTKYSQSFLKWTPSNDFHKRRVQLTVPSKHFHEVTKQTKTKEWDLRFWPKE